MRITDEQARAIAEAAIAFEQARNAVLEQQRKRRAFHTEHYDDGTWEYDGDHVIDCPGDGWDTPKNEAAHMASYDTEAALMKERDRKRRAYRKAVKTVLAPVPDAEPVEQGGMER